MDCNYLIGEDNKLPWKIPTEMKYFLQTISDNAVLMGAKTFESIGKPLKNCYNIIITRNKKQYSYWKDKNLTFTDDLQGILELYKNNPKKHIFVIGGREIYQQTYTYADYYYVSIVKGEYKGNVYLPNSLIQNWNKAKLEKKKEHLKFTAYVYKNI